MDLEKLNELIEGKKLVYANGDWGKSYHGELSHLTLTIKNGNPIVDELYLAFIDKTYKPEEDMEALKDLFFRIYWKCEEGGFRIWKPGDSFDSILEVDIFSNDWLINDCSDEMDEILGESGLDNQAIGYFISLFDEARRAL